MCKMKKMNTNLQLDQELNLVCIRKEYTSSEATQEKEEITSMIFSTLTFKKGSGKKSKLFTYQVKGLTILS